ncbi:MAG: hypothetical protein K0Q49_264 [Haloplasmataceae bacterium]|jgi:uncharacterized secreted protein with C-terminal beta-propeller domain|nr:hypothetical protein [Haloplasmataceae bacterium]
MYIIIVFLIFACFYFLVLKNIIKLNKVTAPLMIIIVTILTSLLFKGHQVSDDFKIIDNSEVKDIWFNYHDEHLKPVIARTSKMINKNKSITEPNYVVTDNVNLYSIVHEKVVINDVNSLGIKKELTFDKQFKPMYLSLTNTKLVVIGEIDNSTTEVFIYNKSDYRLFKQLKINAKYVSSKIINDHFYLVTSSMINNPKQIQTYVINNEEKTVDNLYHVKNTYTNNYVNIIKTNLDDKFDIHVMSYLGLGYTIYFSDKNIYISEEKFNKEEHFNKTIMIKIDNNKLELINIQEVKGLVLDENSINEYNNQLRVATSESYDDYFTNHIYILDDDLKLTGKLENFSTGNQLQATTFIEDKAYIQTFNINDPFYVIDLKNKNPKIISEVDFPGYDTYLLPYDKNHLIAFGLVLDKNKNPEGLKISLYQVTNTVKLISQDRILYKDYNDAFTEVMYDQKTLLVDKDNNLIGFPVTYWLGLQPDQYKQLFFVYQINLDKGLKRLGSISHNSVNENNVIKSGLVIKNKLYTVSDNKIQINNISDLKLINQKVIK